MTTATDTVVDEHLRHAVLEHLARYRITVLPAVQRMPAFGSFGRKRTAAVLRELCRSRMCGHAPLYRNRRYFFLAPRGAEAVAVQSRRDERHDPHGPLSEQAKIRNYAILAFCCLGGRRRQRLSAADFENCFPRLYRPGLSMSYYVDTSGPQPRLGFIRVDTGGRGRWDRVLAKCRNDLKAHYTDRGFREFIDRQAFEITLITALPQKAQRLAEALAAGRDPTTQMIRISVMPVLLNLIAPPPC